MIVAQKGFALLWLSTATAYDTQAANEILHATSLKNSSTTDFFIIVEQVEKMPRVCANRILKTLEEPPPGYKFIFTTQNLTEVLDTIKSRCFVVNLNAEQTVVNLGRIGQVLFAMPPQNSLESFFALVDEIEPDQATTMQELENLRELATRELMANVDFSVQKTSRILFLDKLLAVCNQFTALAVTPGSGKLFWKSFIVQLVV